MFNDRFPAAKIHSGVATAFQTNYVGPEVSYAGVPFTRLQPHRLGRLAAVHRAGRPVSQVRLPGPVVEFSASTGINGPQYLGGTAITNEDVVGTFLRIYTCPSDDNPPAVDRR